MAIANRQYLGVFSTKRRDAVNLALLNGMPETMLEDLRQPVASKTAALGTPN
jgi:hypothetical protein